MSGFQRLYLRANPGIEEAKILGLERRTLKGENNMALKNELIYRWKQGPFGVVAARHTAARKLQAHGKAALKAVKQQLLPLELQEWAMRKAEREANERVELEDAARLEQTLQEEAAYLEAARADQARAAHTAKTVADKEANRLALWMVKKKVAKGAGCVRRISRVQMQTVQACLIAVVIASTVPQHVPCVANTSLRNVPQKWRRKPTQSSSLDDSTTSSYCTSWRLRQRLKPPTPPLRKMT